ncbi:MAG: DUF2782 domain-containing protein [Gammaproteobacteria bacterium]
MKHNNKFALIVCLSVLALPLSTIAEEEPEYVDVPPPPARVESDDDVEALEPEVTIIQRKDATVEEYRVNGLLYMIKITPIVGKSYYLVDKNGDGLMESKITALYNDFRVPQWVLFSW